MRVQESHPAMLDMREVAPPERSVNAEVRIAVREHLEPSQTQTTPRSQESQ